MNYDYKFIRIIRLACQLEFSSISSLLFWRLEQQVFYVIKSKKSTMGSRHLRRVWIHFFYRTIYRRLFSLRSSIIMIEYYLKHEVTFPHGAIYFICCWISNFFVIFLKDEPYLTPYLPQIPTFFVLLAILFLDFINQIYNIK